MTAGETAASARRRALRPSDVLLAAAGYAASWAVAVIIVSIVEEAMWRPGDLPGSVPTWVLAVIGAVPAFLAALVVYVAPALLLRERARPGWFILSFAVASMIGFFVLSLVLTMSPGEMLALDWGLRQVLVILVVPAACGSLAGLIAWRRALWRQDLARATTYPKSAPWGGPPS